MIGGGIQATLLSDGTRALTRAGRWTEALQHARQHKGIGDRLLDGRQVAILAHCEAGDYGTALHLLADSLTPTPWEEAVAASMKVLYGSLADRPSNSDIATMMDRYLVLETAPEHVVFHVRLGLCVIDVAASDGSAPQVADVVVRAALDSADAYAARDVLSHETCLAHTTVDASQALTETVRASGLVTSRQVWNAGPCRGLYSIRSSTQRRWRKTHWPRRSFSRITTAECTGHAKTPRSPTESRVA